MSYLFGPVPSRRLGRSLGVDLVPRKTCTYDCIYCEVGPTTHLTGRRQPYQVEAIIGELAEYLGGLESAVDFITLAGSGEPTLNAGLEAIIAAVRRLTDTPVAVLTNGSLLHLPEVRDALRTVDVVLPSLDAASEATFRRINRPLPSLTLEKLLRGLAEFRREFDVQIWLEVMMLKGINDQEAELAALRQEISKLAPDRVQLNTAVRPVVEDSAQALSREEMEAVAGYLGSGVEIIAAFEPSAHRRLSLPDRDLLAVLARRPMTARDLAQALSAPLSQVQAKLKRLRVAGLISCDMYHGEGFYRCSTQPG